MKSFVLAVLCCGCVSSSLQAQERWSLRQCIDYAIAHNIDIRRTANAAAQSRVEANTAKWLRLPAVSVNANQGWSWGRGQTAIKDEETGNYNTVYVNTASHNTGLSVGASMPLFTGFQITNQKAAARLNLKAALADLEKAKEDLSVNVASSYLQALFNEELMQVAKTQVLLSEKQLERIACLEELGRASAAEVAEAKARVAQDELNAVQSENNYRLALLDLSQLIELPTPEGFALQVPALSPDIQPLTPPDEIYQVAAGSKPVLQAANYRYRSADHAIRIAKSGHYPQINLSGSLGSSYFSSLNRSFSEQLKDNFSKSLSISMNLPLFDRFGIRNRVRTARLQKEAYALQLESVKKSLYKEIQQAWYNATAAESKYTSAKAAALAGEENFRLMGEKYENGRANAVEYQEAKQNLMRTQSDELQAKYEYLFRTKILDFYKGIEIR